jgi:chromosome segregation ATPase
MPNRVPTPEEAKQARIAELRSIIKHTPNDIKDNQRVISNFKRGIVEMKEKMKKAKEELAQLTKKTKS